MKRTSWVITAGILIAVSAWPSQAWADQRAKLPAESLLYFEYAGSDAYGKAYRNTSIGKMLSEPKLASTLENAFAALYNYALQETEPDEQPLLRTVHDLLLTVLRKGLVVDLVDVGIGPGGPTVSAVAFVPAGDASVDLVSTLEKMLLEKGLPPSQAMEIAGHSLKAVNLPPPAPPLMYGALDGAFWVFVGQTTAERTFAAQAARAASLASHPKITEAWKAADSGSDAMIAFAFVDVAGALLQARTLAGAMTGANEFPPPVTNFLNATGLADLHSVTWSTSIAAGGFKHRLHAACPAPRRGLLRLLEQKPLDDADLKWLPRDATFAVVGNLDIPAAFDALKSGALALDAPADDIQSFMAKADEALGLKLREDFLAAFDDGIAMFDAPSQGGFFLTGMAWVFEVKDEAAIDRGMRACVNAIAKLLEREKIQITVKQAPIDGRDISFVTVPGKPFPFVPAWALHDKHLVIGLAPQTVALTLERISSSDAVARSLLGNEDFQRARRQLPEKLTQLAYADTQFAARRGYPFLLLGMSAALNAATGHGGEIDLATLPDARTFTGAMFADVSGIAVDDAGVSNVIHGPLPFPASGLLVANMSSTPLMISILLPSLSRARALSKRLVSVQNLRGIGVACMVYSQDHDGNFPPDLEALFTEGMLTSRKILVAPQAGGDEPSYTYLPGHRDGSDPRWVVAYEDYPDMDEEGANVLFMDGHVEFVKPLAHVHELVAATKEEMATHKKSEKSGEP